MQLAGVKLPVKEKKASQLPLPVLAPFCSTRRSLRLPKYSGRLKMAQLPATMRRKSEGEPLESGEIRLCFRPPASLIEDAVYVGPFAPFRCFFGNRYAEHPDGNLSFSADV